MTLTQILTPIFKLQLPEGVEAVKQNETGLLAVTVWRVLRLLCSVWKEPLRIVVEEGGIALHTNDGKPIFIGIPNRVISRTESYLPDIAIVQYSCPTCGALHEGRWRGCGCGGTLQKQIGILSPDKYLCWYLVRRESGQDSPLERIVRMSETVGITTQALSKSLIQYLQYDALMRLALPSENGRGLDRIATRLGLTAKDLGKVRVHMPIAPWNMKPAKHNAEALVDTFEEMLPHIAAATNCSMSASGSSRPGGVLWMGGSLKGLPLLVQLVTPGAYYHLHRSRMSTLCSSMSSALATTTEEFPVVRIEGNEAAYPAGFSAVTAIMIRPGNTLDMIEVDPTLLPHVEFEHTQRFDVEAGGQLHVRNGQRFSGGKKRIATNAKGNFTTQFDWTEFHRLTHEIEVSGHTDENNKAIGLVILTVHTKLRLAEATKLVDRHSNKGLVNVRQLTSEELYFDTGNDLLRIQMTMNPERLCPPKMKTTSAVAEAIVSMTEYLQAKREGREVEAVFVPADVKIPDLLEKMRTEFGRSLEGVTDNSLKDKWTRLSQKAEWTSEDIHEAIHLPVYSKGTDGILTPIGEGILSLHFWTIQPQLPEVITGQLPIEDYPDLYDEEGIGEVTVPVRDSRSGALIWTPVEKDHLMLSNHPTKSPDGTEHREAAEYLLGGDIPQGVEQLGNQVLRALLYQPFTIRQKESVSADDLPRPMTSEEARMYREYLEKRGAEMALDPDELRDLKDLENGTYPVSDFS
jgi:hypothetical protein